mgnify:CR=1 FL=1
MSRPTTTTAAFVVCEDKEDEETAQQPTKFSCADFWGDNGDNPAPATSENEPEIKLEVGDKTPQPAIPSAAQAADDNDMTITAKTALQEIEALMWGDGDGFDDEYDRDTNTESVVPTQPAHINDENNIPVRTDENVIIDMEKPSNHNNDAGSDFAVFMETSHEDSSQNDSNNDNNNNNSNNPDHENGRRRRQAFGLRNSAAPLQPRATNLNSNDAPWELSSKKSRPTLAQLNHRQIEAFTMQSSLQVSAIAPDPSDTGIQIFADESCIADEPVTTKQQKWRPTPRKEPEKADSVEEDDVNFDFFIEEDDDDSDSAPRNTRRTTASPSALHQVLNNLMDESNSDEDEDDEDDNVPATIDSQKKASRVFGTQATRCRQTTMQRWGGGVLDSTDGSLPAIRESREESHTSTESGELYQHRRASYLTRSFTL